MRRQAILVYVILSMLLLTVSVIGCSKAPEQTPEKTPPSAATPASEAGTEYHVAVKDFYYDPAEITIKVGDTITWTNEGEQHHTATGGIFDSADLEPGESYSKTFTNIGVMNYLCNYHPGQMKGKVTITD